jgi:hypothetical protein
VVVEGAGLTERGRRRWQPRRRPEQRRDGVPAVGGGDSLHEELRVRSRTPEARINWGNEEQ